MMIDNEGVLCRDARFCELCGSDGAVLYRDLKDNLLSAPGIWSLCKCSNPECGLLWNSPRPMPDQIGKLYTSYYTHSGGETASFKSSGKTRTIKAILAKVLFWRSCVFETDNFHLQGIRPGELLDVGCGNGAFLAVVAKEGWVCHGIDFDSEAVATANKRDGVRAEVGELIERKYPSNSFDAILMNNVIEHVWNPLETVAECYRILRPGGRLIMITPNAQSEGHKIFKRDWRGLEISRHLFIYTRDAIKALTQAAGFAKAVAFSSSGGSTGNVMLKVSMDLAVKAGRSCPITAEEIPSIIRKETILGMFFSRPVGEWVVAIGYK